MVLNLTSILKFFKRCFHNLPLNYYSKQKIRSFLSIYAPKIISLSYSDPLNISKLIYKSVYPKDFDYKNLQIKFPIFDNPQVSIIIPIFGNIEYTMRCLKSIADNQPIIPFEVIVINDCSLDNSLQVLKRQVSGIRLVENHTNQGFIKSSNKGASLSDAEFLYFLNNDTEVTNGWLDYLVQTFNNLPGTGLVGSKLIYPDGQLQEAGGIVWRDAGAWNFGRGQDAFLPHFNYAREVDYCSGASIMIPRKLFRKLGGFDELFLPAYYEDTDLAFKIREAGFRVIYQPMSCIIHFEGVSSGLSILSGVKKFQVINSKKFYQRWKKILSKYQKNGSQVGKAKDRKANKRVLFIDATTPTPDRDSGSIDAFNHMILLREMGFQVTFIPEDNFSFINNYTQNLQKVGIEVIYRPFCLNLKQHLVEYGNRYDLIFINRFFQMKRSINLIKEFCPKAKILYNTVDLHHIRLQREALLINNRKNLDFANKLKNDEFTLMKIADITTLISDAELKLIRDELPAANSHYFPFSRNIKGTSIPFNMRNDIIFVGSYLHPPNVDAVIYFIKEIMPKLRKKIPGIILNVVGLNIPSKVLSLKNHDIKMIGFVEKLEPFLDSMKVMIAPLRYGAGIKGKIGSALSSGLPVVATSIAAEGMNLKNGKEILIADEPESFANQIALLYENKHLWENLSTNGISFAKKNWGAEVAFSNLSKLLKSIDINVSRSYPAPIKLWS